MNSKSLKPSTPWPLIVLFFIISTGAIISGLFYFSLHKSNILSSSIKELSSIADLKARQVVQWRKERISDGTHLSSNISTLRDFSKFINSSGKDELVRKDLILNMKALAESYDYKSVILVDDRHRVRLYYPDRDTIVGDYLGPLFDEYLNEGKVALTDLHSTEKVSFVHLDLLVPLTDPDRKSDGAIGMLVLRIDPHEVLYPIIESWPVISKSSEALLFHSEGDEIVYLSELRHFRNSDLTFRKPLSESRLPAAMALNGIMETDNGIDYRGVAVVSAMKKIPDSPWYLVVKADRQEVLEVVYSNVKLISMMVVLFILTTGAFLGFFWWNQRVKFYRGKYEAELNRLALVRHFDYILKYANDIILLSDRNFSIVEANDRALDAYQYDRQELIGMSVRTLREDEALSRFTDDIRMLIDAGHATYESVHKRKDGSTFPIEISARIVNIDGVRYYQSISRDITERKAAEETLRESEERFRKIFEDSPFCMVMTSKDMGIIRANNAFCSMMGYAEDELFGMTFRDFTHPEHISVDELSVMRLVAEEIPNYQTEKRYISKDGKIIWGSATISIIRNNKGEIQFFVGMIEDITARKIAELELEKSFSIQKATLESTADGILVVDAEGKIVQCNQKFVELWRIPEEIMLLKDDESALEFVRDQLKYPDRFIEHVKTLYSDPVAVTSDMIEFNDGRFFERYSQPQMIGGRSAGRVWSFRDITDRIKSEADLIAAKNKAEESDRLKTAFLHNVSHEIRTPMNAILGFSSLLNEPELPEADRKQYIDIIFQSGSQLLSIINDIVDLATIESGQVKIFLKEINLNETLRRIGDQFSYKENPPELILELQTPLPDKERVILTDNTKFVQVISNLINNAFKFTPKGKIEFGYQAKEGSLEFFVKDTGIGIPSEQQSKVFDRFYQVDNAVSRQFTGTGLGLSICKAYVELLGGEIMLSSQPGAGTIFKFTIPVVQE